MVGEIISGLYIFGDNLISIASYSSDEIEKISASKHFLHP